MSKDYKTMENILRLPHKFAAGETYTRFYAALKEEKLLATRCPACGKVLLPARSFCPHCRASELEWVEVEPKGQLVSWTWSDRPYFGAPAQGPVITALIRIDGTDGDFLHLLGGIETSDVAKVRSSLRRGMRLKAVWNADKQGRMLDIRYFEPVA